MLGLLKSTNNARLPPTDPDLIRMKRDLASEIFFFFKLLGDSIRWQNLGTTVVKIHILGPGHVVCSIEDKP